MPSPNSSRAASGAGEILSSTASSALPGQSQPGAPESLVLDSPLRALHYFMQELRTCPGAPDLMAGDVVTTGTWTDAWPVQPGERWTAKRAAPLSDLSVTFR